MGSNDALAALSILCSHDHVGNQCILDFVEGSRVNGVGRMMEIALSSPPTPPSTAASIAALAAATSSSSSSTDDADNESSSSDNTNKKKNAKLAAEWNEWRKSVNYACALLANATRNEKGAVEFIGLSFPKEAIPTSMVKDMSEEKDSQGDDDYDASDANNNAYGKQHRDTTKPTATLLLSRFLNPAVIDTSSPGYKAAMEEYNKQTASSSGRKDKKANPDGVLDEYSFADNAYDSDSDLDEDDLDKGEGGGDGESNADKDLELKKVEPIVSDSGFYDPYQHVAAVIMNVTQLEIGRNFLMRLIHGSKKSLESIQEDTKTTKDTAGISTSHLQSLLPQLTSPNLRRRQGMAGTLKNSCFAIDSIWWLLNVVHMDKSLLMTLAGPEELTIDEKVGLDPDYWLSGAEQIREPNALVRLYVIEALLLLLASGRRARETLRERRTYVVIKLADMVEENEEVSERLMECVQYLRRDEEGTGEGSSDQRAYEKYARGMIMEDGLKNKSDLKMLPPSTTTTTTSNSVDDAKKRGDDENEDYDNID